MLERLGNHHLGLKRSFDVQMQFRLGQTRNKGVGTGAVFLEEIGE